MYPINIYALSRVTDETLFVKYEQLLSQRKNIIKIHKPEQESLLSLVEVLLGYGLEGSLYNGFFISFSIQQISKEFDLLKIDKNRKKLSIISALEKRSLILVTIIAPPSLP